ncbi:hypothetical protein [Acidithiobacillus ferrooxidans]|uniref:hypothetical protein n=1 Tax=Acidithiobacillus ferrooxidans TaxID=920 RepID=UPI0013D57058|nr:hypothetical protein [Acidithiobacillus ferrooxidans]
MTNSINRMAESVATEKPLWILVLTLILSGLAHILSHFLKRDSRFTGLFLRLLQFQLLLSHITASQGHPSLHFGFKGFPGFGFRSEVRIDVTYLTVTIGSRVWLAFDFSNSHVLRVSLV